MPIGFAKNIFTTSSAVAGADFSSYDGSNDITTTHSLNVKLWMGFMNFDDTYGVVFYTKDPGSSNDKIMARLVTKAANDSLTFGSEVEHSTTNSTNFNAYAGVICRTQNNEIFAKFKDNADARVYRMSGSSMLQSNSFSFAHGVSGSSGAYNTGDQDGSGNDKFFYTDNSRTLKTFFLVDADTTTPSIATTAETTVTPGHLNFDRMVKGFVDSSTMIGTFNTDGSNATDINKANKLVLGNTSMTNTFAGLGTFAKMSNLGGHYVREQATPEFPTTAFSDKLLLFERRTDNGGEIRVTQYKSGDTSYSQSTLQDSTIAQSDVSCGGCYLGGDDTTYFLMVPDFPEGEFAFMRYNTATNSLTRPILIDEGSAITAEEARFARWGNSRGIMFYDTNKVRIIKP